VGGPTEGLDEKIQPDVFERRLEEDEEERENAENRGNSLAKGKNRKKGRLIKTVNDTIQRGEGFSVPFTVKKTQSFLTSGEEGRAKKFGTAQLR